MQAPSTKCSWSVTIVLLSFLPSAAAQAAASGFPNLSTVKAPGAAETGAASSTYDGLVGAPTVTDGNAVPTYPPPAIPPTADAPFMQKSSLPSGTVFICAGAILGVLLACFMLWRAWVAWSIHQSMKRLNGGYLSLLAQGPTQSSFLDSGAQLLKKSNPFYKQPPSGSMISMSLLHNEEQRADSQTPVYRTGPDKQSLFFSPTASSGLPSGGLAAKKGSEYMPSGYYAAAEPARSQSQSYSLGNLPAGPQGSINHRRPSPHSPAPLVTLDVRRDSSRGLAPSLPPANQSRGSLGMESESRAPSAYVEDMFDVPPVPQSERGGLL